MFAALFYEGLYITKCQLLQANVISSCGSKLQIKREKIGVKYDSIYLSAPPVRSVLRLQRLVR